MDAMAWVVMVLASAGSMAGAATLCAMIVSRNREEARRERFGLPPGADPWP